MGLYTSFSTSDYYDEPITKKQPVQKTEAPKKVEQKVEPIKEEVKKSLYAQATEIATSSIEYKGPDFRDIYRVGQLVAIQGPNGNYRTTKGRIAEIVAENLMYVYMEDTYKDATDQWLVDFVTDKDTITLL